MLRFGQAHERRCCRTLDIGSEVVRNAPPCIAAGSYHFMRFAPMLGLFPAIEIW
jgi:hypothetical protein